MRDPERIKPVLAVIAQLWRKSPDMRLGQLMDYIKGELSADFFYIEDEDLCKFIRKLLKEEKTK